MKRASLTVSPAKPKTEAPDLTDRLLSRGETPAPKRSTPKPAAKRPEAASRPKAKTAPAAPSAPKSPPALQPSSAPSSVPSVTSVDKALAQSRAALTALKVAADDIPARYDTAIRVRLDSLAHHIQQIAEYLVSAARK